MSLKGFLLGVLVALAALPADGQPLRVMGFSGSSNWPIFVAQEKGLFARHGVEAGLMAAPGSATQLARLIEGRIEIAMTAMDNVVAYEEGDLFAFLGVSNGGRLNLMVAPTVKSYADLKGRTLAVDGHAAARRAGRRRLRAGRRRRQPRASRRPAQREGCRRLAERAAGRARRSSRVRAARQFGGNHRPLPGFGGRGAAAVGGRECRRAGTLHTRLRGGGRLALRPGQPR